MNTIKTKRTVAKLLQALFLGFYMLTATPVVAADPNPNADFAQQAAHAGNQISAGEKLAIQFAQLFGLLTCIGSVLIFKKAKDERSGKTYAEAGLALLAGLALWWLPVIMGSGSATIFV